ncbi:MAG: hypothetical protein IJ706_02985 [Clostridia bacterium]|nr:hypothetical protein [Clostridia bacterium]
MQLNWQIDYTTTSSGTTTTTGTGYSVNVQTSASDTITATVSIYGDSYSGAGNFKVGDYIRSGTVNIAINSSISQGTIRVLNSSGTEVGSGMKSISLSNLADGLYNVEFVFGGGAWVINARSGASSNTIATSSFYVDGNAPVISGASLSASGKFVNNTFTVSAFDSSSGVENLYMKGPSDSGYTAYGTTKTISYDSRNGLYAFYAKDKAGNNSATHYVYLDSVKPFVTISDAYGPVTSATNKAFKATATDSGSGIDRMQYKKPSDTAWQSYISGTEIAATSMEGTYNFRAYDKAGNVSEVRSIVLDKTKPTIMLYGGDNVVQNNGESKAEYIRVTATDNLSGVKVIYVKAPGNANYTIYSDGSQYTVNGRYNFYCVDNAGNQSDVYGLLLDNKAPEISCRQTDFYSSTKDDFTVEASDDLSDLTLYYKMPVMTYFMSTTEKSFSVFTTEAEGKYYFYAVDSLGNTSETIWIELALDAPEATVIRDEKTNWYKVTWEGDGTGTLNDEPYVKETWIKKEGKYAFTLTDNSGKTFMIEFTISHCFVWHYIKNPTCTEKGYTHYKCLTCNTSYNDNYVDEKGHNYSIVITQPTCQERGYTTYTCSVCGDRYTDDYVEPTDHSYTKTIITATCMSVGYTIYKCDYCGYDFVDDYITPSGHDYKISVVESTCTENGYTLYRCSNCGDEYKTDETYALGHDYNETTIGATCVKEGCVKHTCTRCGDEYESDIIQAFGHKYVSEVTRQVTCENDGNRRYVCSRCGDTYDTVIQHFGHTFEMVSEQNDGGNVIMTYQCEKCGITKIADVGNQYEEVSNYMEYLFELYSPYMIYVFLATSGVWSLAMGITYILARKNEEREKAKKMLVNYGIGMIVIFVILVAVPFLIKGITVLIAG